MAVLLTQGLMANDASKVDTVLRENRLDLIQVSGIGIFLNRFSLLWSISM